MRSRTNRLWLFAGSVALVVAMALAYHPGFAPGPSTGMSAPAAPKTFVEQEPVAKLLRSHFDWCAHGIRPAASSFILSAAHAEVGVRPVIDSSWQYYGPLYRRPPPSVS